MLDAGVLPSRVTGLTMPNLINHGLPASTFCAPADMYAFGWMLLEIVTGKNAIRRGDAMEIDDVVGLDKCSRSVAELISSCLAAQPDQRPTAQHATSVIDRSLTEDYAGG